jgi:superfamily II helicase
MQRGCGIIYCRTRDLTEEVAQVLTKTGVPTVAYHAGMRFRNTLNLVLVYLTESRIYSNMIYCV